MHFDIEFTLDDPAKTKKTLYLDAETEHEAIALVRHQYGHLAVINKDSIVWGSAARKGMCRLSVHDFDEGAVDLHQTATA